MNSYLKFILMSVLLISGIFSVVLSTIGVVASYQAHNYQVSPVVIICIVATILFPAISLTFVIEYWHSQQTIKILKTQADLKYESVIFIKNQTENEY